MAHEIELATVYLSYFPISHLGIVCEIGLLALDLPVGAHQLRSCGWRPILFPPGAVWKVWAVNRQISWRNIHINVKGGRQGGESVD